VIVSGDILLQMHADHKYNNLQQTLHMYVEAVFLTFINSEFHYEHYNHSRHYEINHYLMCLV
jgi:hypothetical protein